MPGARGRLRIHNLISGTANITQGIYFHLSLILLFISPHWLWYVCIFCLVLWFSPSVDLDVCKNDWILSAVVRHSNFSHHGQDVVMWLNCRGSRIFERSRGNEWMSDWVRNVLVAWTRVPITTFVSVTSYYKFRICFINPHFTHPCRDAEGTCLQPVWENCRLLALFHIYNHRLWWLWPD